MVGGQMLDLEAEQRTISAKELATIHSLKTGKLLTVSLRVGAILSEASHATLESLTLYGERIGLAFQIVDDILDIEGDEAQLGKSVHSDVANQKSTYPSLFGLTESKAMADNLIQQAQSVLEPFGERADYLRQLANYILSRTR
jgi:geranylgeranyl diphosphate synthase type II